jgi:hypothetical protein
VSKKDLLLVLATVLTIILTLITFFFNLYNNNFELKNTELNNPYILLKNGRYFELLCQNDVIDNSVDFSLKPFNEIFLEKTGNSFKQNIICKEYNGLIEKEILLKRTPNQINIRQDITMDIEGIKKDSFYYTQIDYPLIADIDETNTEIKLYDLNCTTVLPKRAGYDYKIVEKSIRVGKKYEPQININIDMQIQCL